MPDREEGAGPRPDPTAESPTPKYLLSTDSIEGVTGETFEIGRPVNGETVFEITADPTRPDVEGALRVLMGPFTVYTPENVEAAAG